MLALAFAACVATIGTYHQVVDYGFNYDDYHQVRPYTTEEVLGTFSGSWDPLGIEVPFYRPLTTAFYALRFEVLGIDARLYHALSLTLFAIAATMVGALLLCIGARPWLAVLGTLIFAVHPSMPYPLVVWATSQMHLLQTLIVLGALLWWTVCRDKRAVWWTPLLGFQTIVFLVKEDGLMLLPCIALVHGCYRWLVDRSTPRIPWSIVGASVGVMAALLSVRHLALGRAGGYGIPGWRRAWANWSYGLVDVFLQRHRALAWQAPSRLLMLSVSQVGLAAAAVLPRLAVERFTIALGVCLALVFNLPFALVSKPLQWHLVALGHSLVLTGALGTLLGTLPTGRWKRAALAAAFASVVLPALAARSVAADFAPRSAMTLYQDEIVLGWSTVPAEVRDVLARKPFDAGASLEAIDVVAFGTYGREAEPNGRQFRWTSGHVTLMVDKRAVAIRVPVRAAPELAARGEGIVVRVEGGGQVLSSVRLRNDRWIDISVRAPRRRWWEWGTRRRIDMTVEPTFVPADENPGSEDRRELGVKLGDISVTR